MKKHKGSILAVTLVTLSIILTMALSVSLVAIKQRNASLGSGKSNRAFQNADTGVEDVMKKIIDNSDEKVGNIFSGICSGGKIIGSGYSVELKKEDGTTINCSDNTVAMANISSIKSVGTDATQQSRAIEAAVASRGSYQVVCVRRFAGATNRLGCYRIATDTGEVRYKTADQSGAIYGSWSAAGTIISPTTVGPIGTYMLTCLENDNGATPSDAVCCRVNTNDGTSECKYGGLNVNSGNHNINSW